SVIILISLQITFLPAHLSALGIALAICAKLLYYLYIFFKNPKLINAFVPSLIIGFLSLYRHDFAFLLSGMVFQTFGFYIIFQIKEKGYWKIGIKKFLPYVLVYLLGLLPAILIWLYIVQIAGFSVVKDLLFDIPLNIFADYRALPFPMPWD